MAHFDICFEIVFEPSRLYAGDMPFEITTTRFFSAGHQLRLADGSLEPLHGHNWRARVRVGADGLDAMGTVMDFHLLEKRVDAVITPWHNTHLNDSPDFETVNPSAENVAATIARKLKLPRGVRLIDVEVWETDTNSARFSP